jgi:hypothetical protein
MVVHRRGGKTVASINDKVKRAIQLTLPHGRYAYVAPYLAQAKEVAWDYLKRFAGPIIADKNESELWVELLNGARIRIHGADNPDRLRGAYLDGVVLDEYADMRPSVWGEVIRPMLADRQGWATFIGTPKGRNEFWEVWDKAQRSEAWFSMMLRASETGILPQEELDDALSDMTPEQYAQEFECSFEAAILGAYFGKEMADADRDGRLTEVPYDPGLPCYTAWDLGKGANMPVWIWQPTHEGVNVIDYVEGVHSDGIPQVLAKTRGLGYAIEADYVPEDAKATGIGSGRTRIEQLKLNGGNPRVVEGQKIDDRISAARLTLPRARFDKLRCKDGIEALRQYKADFDEVLKTFKDAPLKNWASHPADAFQCLARAWRTLEPPKKAPPPARSMQINAPSTATFNDVIGRLGERRREDERI